MDGMENKNKKIDYKEWVSFWESLIETIPSIVLGLVILFIVGVVVFAIIKWAFQIVF